MEQLQDPSGATYQRQELRWCLFVWTPVLPSWEAPDSTYGNLCRSRHRTAACRRSHWSRTGCRSCTRCTARGTSWHWSACSQWTGDRSDVLIHNCCSWEEIYEKPLTWSPALSASDELLRGSGLLVVVGITQAEITVIGWVCWRLQVNKLKINWEN